MFVSWPYFSENISYTQKLAGSCQYCTETEQLLREVSDLSENLTLAAMTAYPLAIENEHITTDIVEVSEFPYLAQKCSVMGIPKVVMNENRTFEGVLPEQPFAEHVLNSIH